MPNKWQTASEVVFGLVLTGKISDTSVNASHLQPPYDQALGMLRQGKTDVDIMAQLGIDIVFAGRTAGSRYEGADLSSMVSVLDKAYLAEMQSVELEQLAKRIRKGEDLDTSALRKLLDDNPLNTLRYVHMDQVEARDVVRLPTYYDPIDFHVGSPQDESNSGVPEAQLIVVGARPGSGKSSLFAKIAANCAWHGKKVLLYTLEMLNYQIAWRTVQVSGLPKEYHKNIIICDDRSVTAENVAADASSLIKSEDLYMIGVDYTNLMVNDEDVSQVTSLFAKLQTLALKGGGPPVWAFTQLSGQGGIPRVNNLRWSRMIEAFAGQIFLLYNPQMYGEVDNGSTASIRYQEGRAYIIEGKSKFGYRRGGPGYITVDWDGEKGWGDQSYSWTPL